MGETAEETIFRINGLIKSMETETTARLHMEPTKSVTVTAGPGGREEYKVENVRSFERETGCRSTLPSSNEVDRAIVKIRLPSSPYAGPFRREVFIDGDYTGTFNSEQLNNDAFLAGLVTGKRSR